MHPATRSNDRLRRVTAPDATCGQFLGNLPACPLYDAWHLVGPPLTGGKILVAALVAIVIILVFSIPHNSGKAHQTAASAAVPVTVHATRRRPVGPRVVPA